MDSLTDLREVVDVVVEELLVEQGRNGVVQGEVTVGGGDRGVRLTDRRGTHRRQHRPLCVGGRRETAASRPEVRLELSR